MIAALQRNPLFNLQLDRLDVIVWVIVLLFFGVSAVVFNGDPQQTLLGSAGIVGLMLLVSHSINLIIQVLQTHPKLGELTGYITNGPEALVMLVGLINAKLGFAMGVPLGSNFANPVLWFVAMVVTATLATLAQVSKKRVAVILLITMALAASFFQLTSPTMMWAWVVIALTLSIGCYLNRGSEGELSEDIGEAISIKFLLPAVLLLVVAGYFLDPIVTLTAASSRVPEGIISFAVLSFITSWPEFRSAAALLKQKQPQAAVMNILVSNITNLWLAISGTAIYLLYY